MFKRVTIISVVLAALVLAAGVSSAFGFGVADFSTSFVGAGGLLDTQAASHPDSLTAKFDFSGAPEQEAKNIVVDLPVGFVGDPQATPRCSPILLISGGRGPEGEELSGCPPDTKVGWVELRGGLIPIGPGGEPVKFSVYNLVPSSNYPAEFGFAVLGQRIFLHAQVRTGSDYGVRVSTAGVPEITKLTGATFTFFGDPEVEDGGPPPGAAFFTNPSDCGGGPLVSSIHVDSWQNPAPVTINADGSPELNGVDFSDPQWQNATYAASPPVTGCGQLQFTPSLGLQLETTQADEPTGLAVDLRVPQSESPTGLSAPPLKDVTVTLPAGMSVSPSAADGLGACSDAQFAISSTGLGSCPDASVVGTALAVTPLLTKPLEGFVFLGTPECDPCSNADAAEGRMVRLFLQLQGSGVIVKVAGRVYLNPTTGQITTTFLNNPQAPVSDLQLQFKGGLRAALATPQSCGVFTATSDLTPWSAPFTPDATPEASFDVDWDGAGGACPAGGLPLVPSFSAGTSNPNAGQFSPFTLTFAREDRQQDISQISVHMPPGLLGVLTGVPLCGEPQAEQGTCPEASRIGTMTVAAGPGGHPFYTKGSLYLTKEYEGAPFGLSIVVPTVAGPFNLGNVVVRARINVDETSAALTVTTDPLPQVIDGIPLRLRTANVTVERPGFIFNPTNCALQRITATIAGAQGGSVQVSSPFAVSGCAGLHFGPDFTVSTSGRYSRTDGTSLDAKVTYPVGTQSNIAHLKVELPKQLPARLTTLQKACTAAVFEANPADCPAASVVGIAKASTPVLPVQLSGPVIFVSHGGEAFPDLIIVLQGYGVRVDLDGATFISKAGITSSTFDTIPDVPVNSFELYLPEGPYSALTTDGNLCTSSLAMPTSFVAQDGAELKQNARIAVTGCPKVKRKTKHARKAQRARKARTAGERNRRAES